MIADCRELRGSPAKSSDRSNINDLPLALSDHDFARRLNQEAGKIIHYGVSEEDLAMVAVIQREWAAKNPRASFRDPITVDDVLNSAMIAWSLPSSAASWGNSPI